MMTRIVGALPAALLITATLILSMTALVAQGDPVTTDGRPIYDLGFAPEIDDSELRQPDLIEKLDLPDPIRPPPQRRETGSDEHVIHTGPPATPTPIDNSTAVSWVMSDSPLVVVVRPRPQFPPRMAARGISGYVDVIFDVLPSGSVSNVEVIASSHSGFESAAIRAAERFRYQPAVIDGVPQTTSGMRYRFRFDMDN